MNNQPEYSNAYLLTGGNIGDRVHNLQQAGLLIEQRVGSIISQSSVYETAAWGKTDQPSFLNQVLHVHTTLSPNNVLTTIFEIEKHLGRQRTEKFAPRTIDIDILFYNNDSVQTDTLVIPHPQLHNRRFVLEPLNEIAPQLIHPLLHKTIHELLLLCNDPLEVKRYDIE